MENSRRHPLSLPADTLRSGRPAEDNHKPCPESSGPLTAGLVKAPKLRPYAVSGRSLVPRKREVEE